VPTPGHAPFDEAGLTTVFVFVLIAVLLLLLNGAATGLVGRMTSHLVDQGIPVVSPM
jgi:hypothetical protein